jgi:hypothetical protein
MLARYFFALQRYLLIAIVILMILALYACANTRIANTDKRDQQVYAAVLSSQLMPEDALSQAADIFLDASDEQLELYAPLHFSRAQKSLQNARNYLHAGEPIFRVMTEAFRVKSLIADAREFKPQAAKTLAEGFRQKAVLDELGVADDSPEDYKAVMLKLQNLVKEMEGGFVGKALAQQADVIKLMVSLEINTLKQRHLKVAQDMLKKARGVDAQRYAPQSHTTAQQKVQAAENYIDNNYRNRDVVVRLCDEAFRASQHAYALAQEAALLVNLNGSEAEQRVLFMESLLARINETLAQDALGGNSLRQQAEIIAARVAVLREQALLADKIPLADKKPLADKEPLAGKEPSADKKPLAN